MTRYLIRPQRKQRGGKTAAERGTRLNFVTKFLKFFSATQRRSCDVSTWGCPKPTVKGKQRNGYNNLARMFNTQDMAPISREGMEGVYICIRDRWIADNKDSLVSANFKVVELTWTNFYLNLKNEPGKRMNKVPHHRSTWEFSEGPPSMLLSTGMEDAERCPWGKYLGATSNSGCACPDHLHILKGGYWEYQ
ncbi:hypothetical protein GWK47_026648 [Chionoecetes opilio]|uniref:Uncharacterized protein n=1 Tax=Chionoecetes opilio TaxID=41210 RepID=A0A8J8WMN3_CHIOP|nr:hypothetical protein GWK47_026648 [Chionoecetes opilio]